MNKKKSVARDPELNKLYKKRATQLSSSKDEK